MPMLGANGAIEINGVFPNASLNSLNSVTKIFVIILKGL